MLFDYGQIAGSDIGTRSESRTKCESKTTHSTHGCVASLGWLTYSLGDDLVQMPNVWGVDEQSNITGPTGMVVATNWTNLMAGTWEFSLEAAGVLPSNSVWWSGSQASGVADEANVCGEWDTGASTGNLAAESDFADESRSCSLDTGSGGEEAHLVCLCIQGGTQPPTVSPTVQPTKSPTTPTTFGPTSSPTTAAPSSSPTSSPTTTRVLFLYSTDTALKGSQVGNRATSTAACKAHATYTTLNCTNGVALASYPGGDDIAAMTTTYSFDSSLDVRGPTGTQIATSWSDFLDGTILASFDSAGVTSSLEYWWSGSDENGEESAGKTCSGFTSTSGNGEVGKTTSTDGGEIFSFAEASCASQTVVGGDIGFVCLCIEGFN